MNREAFTQSVLQRWADRYGCTVDHLTTPGIERIPDESFAGSGGLHVWHIARRAFVRFDPTKSAMVDAVFEALGAPANLEPGRLTALAEEQLMMRALDGGLLSYLYPPDFRPVATPAGFTMRPLEAGDAQALAELQVTCETDEVEEAEVSVEDEVGFGCFAGDRLVAVATGFSLTGFMDIGVLTHPDFRHGGLGRAGVSTLCTWCIERDILLQYRCAEKNTASHRLALGLGFATMFRSEHVIVF